MRGVAKLKKPIVLLATTLLLWTAWAGVDLSPWIPQGNGYGDQGLGNPVLASSRDVPVQPVLPPLDQRLPLVPLVIHADMVAPAHDLPALEIGQPGGTLQMAHTQDLNAHLLGYMLTENFLGAPGPDAGAFYGNIVESFQVEPGNTHFRLKIRPGLKWSDGTPVTTTDVDFTYHRIWHNDLLNFMGMPGQFKAGGVTAGTPMELRIEDDYVFYLVFDVPYGHFLGELGLRQGRGYADLLKPSHFLKDFHPSYTTEENLQQELQNYQLKYEWQLFEAVDCQPAEALQPACRNFPVLWPWVNVSSGSSPVQFARNPYYFKVDTAGNQLPYIDAISSTLIQEVPWQQANANWNFDLLMATDGLLHWPTFQQVQNQGLQAVQIMEATTDPVAFYLNFTYPDESWRTVVARLEFRQALQQAIDRDAILQEIFHGFGARPPHMSQAFDAEEAGNLLTAAGLDTWDEDGWRQGPDGTPFMVPIAYSRAVPEFQQVAEQISAYLWEVGVRTQLRPTDPYLLDVQLQNNQIQASLGRFAQPAWEHGTGFDYMPNRYWGRQWRLWHDTKGEQGIEPPAPVQRLFALHESRIQARPASREELALLAEIRQIHQEQLYVFNLAEQVGHVIAHNPALRNMPTTGPVVTAIRSGEQFFFSSP